MISKEELQKKFSQDPKRFYEVEIFKELGYERKKCSCGTYYWTINQDTCGDPDAHDVDYSFFKKTKPDERLTLEQMWKKFADFFKKNGHHEIGRYPVVSRWRPDLYFTIASIQDFQRIEKGMMDFEYPANPLIVPQVSLRFNDIPHVGFTGRHLTGFVMAGQHAFNWPKEGYWRDETIRLNFEFLTKYLGLKKEEINYLESVWAMNDFSEFGACLESFSKGLELVNSVFTEFTYVNNQIKELNNKVVDVGWGLERLLWFYNGTYTMFESLFPNTLRKLGVDVKSSPLIEKFAKKASKLGGESKIDSTTLSKLLNEDKKTIEEELMPSLSVFAILDHIRTLLFAVSDGGIPSNIGGGYNLRLILRRALNFSYKYDIDIYEVIPLVAEESTLFPELKENVDETIRIVKVEEDRYRQTMQNASKKLGEVLSKNRITKEEAITLYQSHGISLEMLEAEAKRRNIEVELPSYDDILQSNEAGKKEEEKPIDVPQIQTENICYSATSAKAKVLYSKGNIVVLDKTPFYPEGGGQESDRGVIKAIGEVTKGKKPDRVAKVLDVKRYGSTTVHFLDSNCFKEGDLVEAVVDTERRDRLMAHHTATHLISAACRRVLGKHAWQEGASKKEDSAHLDVAHYQKLSDEEISRIEGIANDFIRQGLKVTAKQLSRNEAEQKYGFAIYQGHGVPAKELRIVIIGDEDSPVDAEACGGLHVGNTSQIGVVKIISTERPHDGVVRINFVAGKAALDYFSKINSEIKKAASMLNTQPMSVSSELEKVIQQTIQLKKDHQKQNEEIAKEVAKILKEGIRSKIYKASFNFDKGMLRAIASAITKERKDVCVILQNSKGDVIGSSGEDSGVDVLEELKKIPNFVGGGRGNYAEGKIKA